MSPAVATASTVDACVRPRGILWCTSAEDTAPAAAPNELRYPASSVLLIGGVYGIGKTTLADRLCAEQTIIDPDRVAAELGLDWGTRNASRDIYAELWRRVNRAARAGANVVCTIPGIRPWQRRTLARHADLHGRELHMIYLDGTTRQAVAGQRARGRVMAKHAMREVAEQWAMLRWRIHISKQFKDGELPLTFGGAWSLTVLDRQAADALDAVIFDA